MRSNYVRVGLYGARVRRFTLRHAWRESALALAHVHTRGRPACGIILFIPS